MHSCRWCPWQYRAAEAFETRPRRAHDWHLLQEGWKCVGIDINVHQEEQTDPVLQAHQGHYKLIQADVGEEKEVQTAIQEASAFLQKSINCLVNNAGRALMWPCLSVSIRSPSKWLIPAATQELRSHIWRGVIRNASNLGTGTLPPICQVSCLGIRLDRDVNAIWIEGQADLKGITFCHLDYESGPLNALGLPDAQDCVMVPAYREQERSTSVHCIRRRGYLLKAACEFQPFGDGWGPYIATLVQEHS